MITSVKSKDNKRSALSICSIPCWHIVNSPTDTLSDLVRNLFNFAFTIAPILAGLVIIYGGFRIMTAAGSPEALRSGREAITAAIIGLVIVFGAWLIVDTIITKLFGLSFG